MQIKEGTKDDTKECRLVYEDIKDILQNGEMYLTLRLEEINLKDTLESIDNIRRLIKSYGARVVKLNVIEPKGQEEMMRRFAGFIRKTLPMKWETSTINTIDKNNNNNNKEVV